jgi:hypothetical protein
METRMGRSLHEGEVPALCPVRGGNQRKDDGDMVNNRETRLTTANDVLIFLAGKRTTTGCGVFFGEEEDFPENCAQGKEIEARA